MLFLDMVVRKTGLIGVRKQFVCFILSHEWDMVFRNLIKLPLIYINVLRFKPFIISDLYHGEGLPLKMVAKLTIRSSVVHRQQINRQTRTDKLGMLPDHGQQRFIDSIIGCS